MGGRRKEGEGEGEGGGSPTTVVCLSAAAFVERPAGAEAGGGRELPSCCCVAHVCPSIAMGLGDVGAAAAGGGLVCPSADDNNITFVGLLLCLGAPRRTYEARRKKRGNHSCNDHCSFFVSLLFPPFCCCCCSGPRDRRLEIKKYQGRRHIETFLGRE